MNLDHFTIYNTDKLDAILAECCQQVMDKHSQDPEYWGMVGACVLDMDNRAVFGVNYLKENGQRCHAERCAIENYTEKYGPVPEGSIIITTLSPCSGHLDERYGDSCTKLINSCGVHKVYCGYQDPVQINTQAYLRKKFHVKVTRNKKLHDLCGKFANTFLDTTK